MKMFNALHRGLGAVGRFLNADLVLLDFQVIQRDWNEF